MPVQSFIEDSQMDLASLLQRVVVVIPAINADTTIGSVVVDLRRIVDTVIVVDDGSTDNTATIAQQVGALVIRHDQSQGRGASLKNGFREARKFFPLAVVTMSADGRYASSNIPHVVEPILRRQADMVIASRYLQPNQKMMPWDPDWWHRFIINKVSGVSFTDPRSRFRAISPWVLQHLAQSEHLLVETEMQFFAHQQNLRVHEVSITMGNQ